MTLAELRRQFAVEPESPKPEPPKRQGGERCEIVIKPLVAIVGRA